MRQTARHVGEYLLWLIHQYHEIKQAQASEIYRIVDIKTRELSDPIITVQLCGKNTTFKLAPQEILNDETLFEGFSKKDIRTITYLACKNTCENGKPKAKVIAQEFCEELNQIVFSIQFVDNKEIIKKSASELTMNKLLISKLSSEEALMVGYILADEHFSKEKTFRTTFKT